MAPASLQPRDAVPAETAARWGAHSMLALVALTLVAVPFGLLLFLVKREWAPLAEFDARALDALHDYAVTHDGFVEAMRLISDVATLPVYLTVFAAVVVWLLRRRQRRVAAFVAVTPLGSWLLNASAKVLVGRARPVFDDPVLTVPNLAFPSGHAQSSMVAFSVLLLVFLPVLAGAARAAAVAFSVLLVLAVGFSRVALGVHYPTDVLGGYVLGIAWVTAMIATFRVWRIDPGRPVGGP